MSPFDGAARSGKPPPVAAKKKPSKGRAKPDPLAGSTSDQRARAFEALIARGTSATARAAKRAIADVLWADYQASLVSPERLLESVLYAGEHLGAGVGDVDFWCAWLGERTQAYAPRPIPEKVIRQALEALASRSGRRGRPKDGDTLGSAHRALSELHRAAFGQNVEPEAMRKRFARAPRKLTQESLKTWRETFALFGEKPDRVSR